METVTGEKYCPKCKQRLPKLFFASNSARADGLASWCRKCSSEHAKPAPKKNPLTADFE